MFHNKLPYFSCVLGEALVLKDATPQVVFTESYGDFYELPRLDQLRFLKYFLRPTRDHNLDADVYKKHSPQSSPPLYGDADLRYNYLSGVDSISAPRIHFHNSADAGESTVIDMIKDAKQSFDSSKAEQLKDIINFSGDKLLSIYNRLLFATYLNGVAPDSSSTKFAVNTGDTPRTITVADKREGNQNMCNIKRVSVKLLMEFFLTGKLCKTHVVRMRFGIGKR